MLNDVFHLLKLFSRGQLVRVLLKELLKLRYSLFMFDVFCSQILDFSLKHILFSHILLVTLKFKISFFQRRHIIFEVADIFSILDSFLVQLLLVLRKFLILKLHLSLKLTRVKNTFEIDFSLFQIFIFFRDHIFIEFKLLNLVCKFRVDLKWVLVFFLWLVDHFLHVHDFGHIELFALLEAMHLVTVALWL